MEVVKSIKAKTQGATVGITPKDLLELKFFLNGILIANKSLSETVSWWITKNEKKLNRLMELIQIEDKALDDEYVAKDEKGRYKLWDEVPGGFTCFLKELPDGKTVFVDQDDKEMPDFEKPMWFWVEGADRMAEYKEKKADFSAKKRPISVVQISRNLLESLNFPTMGSASQGAIPRKLDRELFYDTLVIGEDE